MTGTQPSTLPAGTRTANATGVIAALLAASCCVLPLTLIVLGVAGAGVMMQMMRYEWITLPLGVLGLSAAWTLYYRDKKRCETSACRFAGRRVRQIILGGATLVVGVALLLRLFPSWTAAILQGL